MSSEAVKGGKCSPNSTPSLRQGDACQQAVSYGHSPTAAPLSPIGRFMSSSMAREKVIAFLVPRRGKGEVFWDSIYVGRRFDPEQNTTIYIKQEGLHGWLRCDFIRGGG